MRKRIRTLFRGSIFRRMYLLYALIILVSVSFLGVWLASNMSDMIIEQAIDYNSQQLASLHGVFQSQVNLIEHVKSRLYGVQTGAQTSLYDSVALILRDNKPFASAKEYEEFMYHATLIQTFFSVVQNSLQSEMSLFQIKGSNLNHGNMHILWPLHNLGKMYYAEEIYDTIISSGMSGQGMISYIADPGTSRQRNFYVLYDTIEDHETHAEIGYLINGYECGELDGVFAKFSYPLDGDAYIVRDDGVILYSTVREMEGSVASFLPLLAEADSSRFEAGSHVYNVLFEADHGYYIVGRMDQRLLSAKVTRSTWTILLISLACAAVAVFLTLLSTRMLTRRVRELRLIMHAAQEGNLKVRAEVRNNGDELDQIAGSFNQMMAKLDAYILAEYVAELQKSTAVIRQREAELVALQHQVNPHFLYNTIEVIRMQAVSNGDEDTALLIRWLASLFRRRTGTGMVVTLRDEVSYCSALTEILRAKFNGEIDVIINIPEEIMDYAVLKDLIQPPLENAFIHGFRADGEMERVLRVDGEIEGDVITIRVFNNGDVIESQTLEALQARMREATPRKGENGYHIGLMNLHHRIQLAYGREYGLSIDSREGFGTVVTLTIQALSLDMLQERVTPKEKTSF